MPSISKIPLTELRSLYRMFDLFSSMDCQRAMAEEALRDNNPGILADKFQQSVERFSRYSNIEEAFYPDLSARKQLPDLEQIDGIGGTLSLTAFLKSTASAQVIDNPNLDFHFVDRELVPARTYLFAQPKSSCRVIPKAPIGYHTVKEPECLEVLYGHIPVAYDAENLARVRPHGRLSGMDILTIIGLQWFQLDLIIQPRCLNGFTSSGGLVELRTETVPGDFPDIKHRRFAVGGCEIVCHRTFLLVTTTYHEKEYPCDAT